MTSQLENIELPTWLNGVNSVGLTNAANAYWQQIENYLLWWLEQIHNETDALPILDLLAWERGIERLPGEDLTLYGKRVKHGIANSKDAGSTIGMERIFKRLGFGYVEFNERIPDFDWDMIEISMIESEFSGKQDLVNSIIKQYGRTCRRYFLSAIIAIDGYFAAGLIEFDKEVIT
jgi:hypothetical protein